MRPALRVAILADDLIWAGRLHRIVRDAGGASMGARTAGAFAATLSGTSGTGGSDRPAAAIVDLTSRGYEPFSAIRAAVASGVPVVAVGRHDDRAGRAAALAAGATHVYPYARLHATGPGVIRAWLEEVQAR
jgi:hypothetical protein